MEQASLFILLAQSTYMHELRRYRRLKIPLQVEIRHPAIGTLQVPAADMSDGGVFLLVDECFQLDLTESVIVRALGLGPHGQETGPPLVMTVVRKSPEGMGLSLEEAASANLESLSAEHSNQQKILQSLFIVNDQSRVLLVKPQDSWSLPSRQLSGAESWSQGLQLLLDKLKSDALLENTSSIHIENNCYPNSHQLLPFVDLLIPARLKSSSTPDLDSNSNLIKASPKDPIPESEQHHKWLTSAEVNEFGTMLDPKLVDKLLSLV